MRVVLFVCLFFLLSHGYLSVSNGFGLSVTLDNTGTRIVSLQSNETQHVGSSSSAVLWRSASNSSLNAACNDCVFSHSAPSSSSLVLRYASCCGTSNAVVVTVSINVTTAGSVLIRSVSTGLRTGVVFSVALNGTSHSQLLVPTGWGMTKQAFAIKPMRLTYPSSDATMPFWALWSGSSSSPSSSLYWAAQSDAPVYWQWEPLHSIACLVDASRCQAILSVQVDDANETPAAVEFRPYSGDWWEASRYFASTIAQRLQGLKPYRGFDLFINTGWSPYDVFPKTDQGDPAQTVKDAQAMRALFPNLTIALHWYVWNDVPNFDLLYPRYFPAKKGFKEAVAAIQGPGTNISVFPYINGRLYDQKLPTFPADKPRMTVESDGSIHTEKYGNAEPFAAPCPSQSWWTSDTIPGVVRNLSQTYGVAGVYIDQIAAAPALACYSSSHPHLPGGGDYFVQGNRGTLTKSRSFVPIMTENNADVYVGYADAFLSIANWLRTGSMVPAFPAVYGAVATTVGRIFSPIDLEVDTDIFACKCAQTFTYGSIAGWFSLRGPIGIGAILPKHKNEVAFIEALAKYRSLWFSYGGSSLGYAGPSPVVTPSLFLQNAFWITSNSSAIGLITNCGRSTIAFKATFDVARVWGTSVSSFEVVRVLRDGSRIPVAHSMQGLVLIVSGNADARDVFMVEISAR